MRPEVAEGVGPKEREPHYEFLDPARVKLFSDATGRLRPEAATNYGTCLLALERPAEAIPYFQRAIALDPATDSALAGLETARAMLEP